MTGLIFKRTGKGSRPLAQSSIKTYTALLIDLDYIIHNRQTQLKTIDYETLLDGLTNIDDLWNKLKTSKGKKSKKELTEKRRTMMMSALVSALSGYKDISDDTSKEKIQEMIDSINNIIQPIYKKQSEASKNKKLEKSPAIKKNWATWKELIMRRKELKFSVRALMIKDKKTISMGEYKILQNYLIACLYTMIYPRRNLWRTCKFIDYMEFKKLAKKGELPEDQNYIIKQKGWKQLYFYIPNQKSKRHTEFIQIPKPLKKVIKLTRLHNKSDYLITMIRRNSFGKPVSSDLMTKMINDTFTLPKVDGVRRKIGSKMIRAIHDSRPEIKQVLVKAHEIADQMGHSVETAINNYAYEK